MSDVVAPLSAVPDDSTLLFRVRDAAGAEREAFLVGAQDTDGGSADDDADTRAPAVAAWLNECQHLTHVPLDKGSGAPVRGREVVCANHGAMFDVRSGQCTHGPCEGAVLTSVAVAVRDGAVVLVDDEFDYLGRGAAEGDGDRTSTSNVEW